MRRPHFIRPVIGGILLGAALFFIPFLLLRIIVVAVIIRLAFRAFGRRRYSQSIYRPYMHQWQQQASLISLRHRDIEDIAID